jgi:hypothetical protein
MPPVQNGNALFGPLHNTLMDFIIFFFAIVGAILGVVNLARSHLDDSERLRVALVKDATWSVIGIEVANLSPLASTVTEIKAVHREGKADIPVIDPARGELDQLPKRIEPREAHWFPISLAEANAWRVHHPKYIYVRTALGNIFTTEPLRKRWLRKFREMLGLQVIDVSHGRS